MLEIISSVSSIALGYVGYRLWRKQAFVDALQANILTLKSDLKNSESDLQNSEVRVLELESFCSTVTTTEVEKSKVVILGPRASGKTSIVSLWCKVEKLIKTHSPTVGFNTFEYDSGIIRKENYFDNKIKVERKKIIKKKIEFLDYAGEDSSVESAARRITDTSGGTLIFVMNSDPGFKNDNRRYFSRSLVEKMNDAFNSSGARVSDLRGVYVAFNKIDLHGRSTGNNYDSAVETVKSELSDCIANIESIFGVNVTYFATSARTNHNILNLLQSIVRSYD